MTKLVRSLVLAAAMGGIVFSSAMSAPAQKKDDKKPLVKADDKKAAVADVKGSVEVYKDKAGDYRFKIVGEDGKALAMTTKGYEKKEDALKAIEMVKTILSKAKVTEVKE